MGVITDFVWHLAPFVLVLSLVVTVHELGHFLVARSCGVAVERFPCSKKYTSFFVYGSYLKQYVTSWCVGGVVPSRANNLQHVL